MQRMNDIPWFNPTHTISGKIYSNTIVEIDRDTVMFRCNLVRSVLIFKNSAKLNLNNCQYAQNLMVILDQGNSNIFSYDGKNHENFDIDGDFEYVDWWRCRDKMKLYLKAYEVIQDDYDKKNVTVQEPSF